jgi:DNA-binding IclR family transcriptional regulator
MIKVLTKVLGIIEIAAQESPRPVTLGKLVDSLNINKATCSRIIRDLVDSGYLLQVSRTEGYTIGPRAFSLKRHIKYKPNILAIAEPLIKSCADRYRRIRYIG